MSGVVDYDELFGGAKRGAFAVKRALRKAKNKYGDYTPEANPDPFHYDKAKAKAGEYSKHIQTKIGDVDEEDAVKFKRRKQTKEEKEQNKRLDPETWGINHADLEYDERTNRSYFKVEGTDGWFAFPPIKYTDANGKVWYGLAHYERKPPKEVDAGGEHYDGIAFPEDAIPSDTQEGHFSIGYTRNHIFNNARYGEMKSTTDEEVKMPEHEVELHLSKGVFKHRSFDSKKERYGYYVKTRGEPEILPPTAVLPADATDKQRQKAWRNIVSINTQMEDHARWWGKLNNMANFWLQRHEERMALIEGAEGRKVDKLVEGRKKDADGRFTDLGSYEASFTDPVYKTEGKRTRNFVRNTKIEEKGRTFTVNAYRTLPNGIRVKTKVVRQRRDMVPQTRPIGSRFGVIPPVSVARRQTPARRVYAVPADLIKWKASYERLDKLVNDKFRGWYELAKNSVEQQNQRTEAIRDNDKLLEELGYDGRYTIPKRRAGYVETFWWERPSFALFDGDKKTMEKITKDKEERNERADKRYENLLSATYRKEHPDWWSADWVLDDYGYG